MFHQNSQYSRSYQKNEIFENRKMFNPESRVELKAKETKNKRQIFQKSKEVLRNVGIGQNKDDGKLYIIYVTKILIFHQF